MSALRPLGFALAALLAALVVVADPWIANLMGRGLWQRFHVEDLAIKALPFVLVAGAVAITALRRLAAVEDWERLALVLLLASSQLNGIALGPLDLFDFALFSVFLGWFATSALRTDRPLLLPPLVWLAALLVILAVAHLPVSRPSDWVLGMIGICRVFIFTLLVIQFCRTPERLDAALSLFLKVALASAVLGIVQFGLAYFNLYVFTLIDPPISAYKPTPVGFVMRASGLCITAQHFSSFLVYALPVALWKLSQALTIRTLLAPVILLGGVVVSWNTGAFLAAAAVLAVAPFVVWARHMTLVIVAALSVLPLAYFSGIAQIAWDLTFGDAGLAKGLDQRRVLFELGLEQIRANPLVGTGLRGFGQVDGNYWTRPVHNLLFQSMAELGVLAGVVFVSIFFVLSTEAVRLSATPGATRHAVFAAAGLVGVAILSQSEPNLDQSNFWLVLALVQACAVVWTRRRTAPGVGPAPLPG